MVQLNTERLVIRNFKQCDAKGFYELWAKPRVHCFTGEKIESLDEAIDEIQKKCDVEDETELAVCLADTGEFIGHLFGMFEEPDTYSVCWNFLEGFGGKGYAFEAAKAYISYLFEEKNIRRVYAYVEDNNFPSQKLCERLGMRKEGCFMEFISFVNDEAGNPIYENTCQYAILKKEWKYN